MKQNAFNEQQPENFDDLAELFADLGVDASKATALVSYQEPVTSEPGGGESVTDRFTGWSATINAEDGDGNLIEIATCGWDSNSLKDGAHGARDNLVQDLLSCGMQMGSIMVE